MRGTIVIGEGERDEDELAERGARPDRHQRRIAAPRADERRARLRQRQREGEDQREMAGFDDHGLTAPSCQRPSRFNCSTTSRGM